jgi:hypothetical protein
MNVHAHKLAMHSIKGAASQAQQMALLSFTPQASVPLHSPQAHHLCSRLHDYNTNTWQITSDA